MKKIAFFVLIIVSLSLFASLSGCTPRSSVADDCVRIHIRANSNSDADQKIKLVVRDEVVNYLTPYLAGCESKTDAEKVIDENKTGIAETARSVLRENGFGYTVSVRLTREKFPFRKYGDVSFPEGVYDALIIELGTGEGDNWWCVCFPPLCFVPEDGENENFRYKSRIVEIIKKFRGENE